MRLTDVTGEIKIDPSGAVAGFEKAGQAAGTFGTKVTAAHEKVTTSGGASADAQVVQADKVIGSHGKVIGSIGKVALGAATFAGGVVGLAYTFEKMDDSALRVEKSNQKVEKSTRTLRDVQEKYTDAVAKFGDKSPEALKALNDLEIAQDDVRLAIENSKQANEDNDKALLYTAITVGPQVIMATKGAIDVYKDVKTVVGLYRDARLLANTAEGIGAGLGWGVAASEAAAGTAAATATPGLYAFAGGVAAIAAPAVIAAAALAAIVVSAKTIENQNTTRDPAGNVTTTHTDTSQLGQTPGGFSNAKIAKMSTPQGLLGWNFMGLSTGGYVKATPGGQPVIVAEGGEGEWVIPDSKIRSFVASRMPSINSPGRSSDAGSSQSISIANVNVYTNDPRSFGPALVSILKQKGIK